MRELLSQRSVEAFFKRMHVEQEMDSTPEGRKSRTLREQARRRSAIGDSANALALLREAAALFADDDRGAAAAACWHDLAEALVSPDTLGARYYKLLEAAHYYERAIASPSRDPERDPYRAAISREGLSKVHRSIAALHQGKEHDALVQRAIDTCNEAVQIARNMGPLGWRYVAGCLLTLGNHYGQLGPRHLKRSMACYREGLELLARARREPLLQPLMDDREQVLEAVLQVQLAQVQAASGEPGHQRNARRLLEAVSRCGIREQEMRARLLLARWYLQDKGPEASQQARTHLIALVNSSWPHKDHDALGELLLEAGLLKEAREVLSDRLSDLAKAWYHTATDELGAQVMREQQATAHLLARVYLEEKRPLEAFLRLENVSALTFYERVRNQLALPREPVTRGIYLVRSELMGLAVNIETIMAHLAHISEEHHKKVVTLFLRGAEQFQAAPDAAHSVIRQATATSLYDRDAHETRLKEILEEAISSPAPLAALQLKRNTVEKIIDRMKELLFSRWPEGRAMDRWAALDVQEMHLRELFQRWPDVLLLRLHLDTELIAIAVWQEDGGLRTRTERAEVERCLSTIPGLERPPPPASPPLATYEGLTDEGQEDRLTEPLREAHERWLREARARHARESPSPAQAIRVARLYRYRLSSSHRHNLLSGLAWLHEAMAKPPADPQESVCLRLEAVWLWLELALNEAVHPVQCCRTRPDPVLIERAQRLLAGLSPGFEASLANAWCNLLKHPPRDPEKFVERCRAARKQLEPLLETMTNDISQATALAWGLELLRCEPDLTPEVALPWLARVREMLERYSRPEWEDMALMVRLLFQAWCVDKTRQLGFGFPAPDPDFLTPRERYAFTSTEVAGVPDQPEMHRWQLEENSKCFDALEQALWGIPSDDRVAFYRSTGSLGSAWRIKTGAMLCTKASDGGADEDVPHAFAQLQLGADLHLALVARWSRTTAQFRALEDLPHAGHLRLRERIFEGLYDAACLPSLPGANSGQATRAAEDPFHALLSPEQVLGGAAGLTAFNLAHLARPTNSGSGPRTSAFMLVQVAEALEEWATQIPKATSRDNPIREALPPELSGVMERFHDFATRLPDLEQELNALALGNGIIGLSLGPLGELVGMVQWNSGDGSKGRMRIERTLGARLQMHLLELLRPHPLDATPRRGSATARGKAWLELQHRMDSFLRELLRGRARLPLSWRVFTPGALRPLPWFGLTAKNAPLFQHATSVTHLPAFRFHLEESSGRAHPLACLLAPQREIGDTSFGEAVITTLRRCFPPELVLDPTTLNGTEIADVKPLEHAAPELAAIRLYAQGGHHAHNDTSADLLMKANRTFCQNNTSGLFLGQCEVVELWDATEGIGAIRRLLNNDSDRIPGLAHSFFQAGARAVLDLAWPVHDVVRALVCEHYTLLRERHGLDGSSALTRALRECQATLLQLKGTAHRLTRVEEMLAWIDQARFTTATRSGLNTSLMERFSDRREAPCLEGQEVRLLVEDITHPVHLAAFRYWGSD